MKIRCSALGKIMTSPRSKGEVLSKTAKTYIKELFLEETFGIKKEFSSRYTDKGNEMEEVSINLFCDVYGFQAFKNEEYFENDFIKGTPDLILDHEVIDIKTSWDGTTFPWFEDELPNKDYYWQLIGYLWLTGKSKGRIVYCLVDTPEEIVLDEIRRTSWKKFELEVSDETIEAVQSQHEFSHIPMERRVKCFTFDYNEEVIEQMKLKIEHAREYYESILSTI